MTVDFKDYARKMDKTLEHLAEEFDAVRAGRANPGFWTGLLWNTTEVKHL